MSKERIHNRDIEYVGNAHAVEIDYGRVNHADIADSIPARSLTIPWPYVLPDHSSEQTSGARTMNKGRWEAFRQSEDWTRIQKSANYGHCSDFDEVIQLEMISQANIARKQVLGSRVQHRKFYVGVSIWAFNEFGEHKIISAHNEKPRAGSDARKSGRKCAEEKAFTQAWNEGYRYVRAMAVVGEPQKDDFSKKKNGMLDPCISCRMYVLGDLLELGMVDELTEVVGSLPVGNQGPIIRGYDTVPGIIATHINKKD